MQPRIKQSDVDNMSGEQNVDELHGVFYEDFINSWQARKAVPEWLKEEDEDDYYARLNTHRYDEYVQGEMASWLSNLQADDQDTVDSEAVQEKYRELKNEFFDEYPEMEPKSL